MTGTEELGRGGRLRGNAAGELVTAAYAAESAHGPRLARGLSLADLAHAVALIEGGDLGGDDARSLVRGLLDLHAIPGEEFPWDPALGDAFNAREVISVRLPGIGFLHGPALADPFRDPLGLVSGKVEDNLKPRTDGTLDARR